MSDLTPADFIEQASQAAYKQDAAIMSQTVTDILEHMASQPTREGRMWRRVPVNLLARIEGALRRKDEQIAELKQRIRNAQGWNRDYEGDGDYLMLSQMLDGTWAGTQEAEGTGGD